MGSWERFDETSLPDIKDFYNNINMEDIRDINFRHENKVWKCFKNKKFRRLS